MANIPVERDTSRPWWIWLLGALLLVLLIWLIAELLDTDEEEIAAVDPVTVVDPVAPVAPTDVGPITSIAELADGRNAIGREVNLDDVRVFTLTGDSSFFVGPGTDATATDAGALVLLQGMNESESLPAPPTGADGMYNVDEGDVIDVSGVIAAFDASVPDYADLPAADRDRAMRSGVYINASDVQASGADTEIVTPEAGETGSM